MIEADLYRIEKLFSFGHQYRKFESYINNIVSLGTCNLATSKAQSVTDYLANMYTSYVLMNSAIKISYDSYDRNIHLNNDLRFTGDYFIARTEDVLFGFPILLTTGAVVIGASIILFDPIFQGLAISLVAGAIVSTLLTLIVVPLIYYITERKKWEKNN